MAPGEHQRERLELEDFEVVAGESFDPVNWLNARLARGGGVPYDRLDKHLSSLGMSCQLLCQDTSESIEMACNQLVLQLPSAARDLERMQQDASKGRGRLGDVLEGLKDADDKKRSGLHALAEIDAVKTRVQTACSALREVGSWERRVRDCEQLVHSGSLPPALAQLTSLKEVLDAFRMLPEYAKKEEQLGQLEESLLKAARRKARLFAERGAASDLKGCCEVLVGMGRPDEPAALAINVFQELAEKAWQGQNLRPDASATELGTAVQAVFDAFVQAFEERRELLRLIDSVSEASQSAAATGSGSPALAPPSDGDATGAPPAGPRARAAAAAARAALLVLAREVEARLPGGSAANSASAALAAGEEANVFARSSRAIAILAAYVDGFEALAKSSMAAESPELLAGICRDDTAAAPAPAAVTRAEVLPWLLLREVALFAILRPMQDEAAALAPADHGTMRPSEAVLAAESSAKKLFQMATSWAQRLEQQGIARLAVLWLASVDETCAVYWRQWGALFETFRNTMEQNRTQGSGGASDGGASAVECSFDASLLNECMQLHGMLHDSIPLVFATFQDEAVQLAIRMMATSGQAFGSVLEEKLKEPTVWCEQLAVPSAAAVRAAGVVVLGPSAFGSTTAEVGSGVIPGPSAGKGLPATAAALAAAEKEARGLVTRCCVQPVTSILAGYPEDPQWTLGADASDLPGGAGLLPLQRVTAVGEHLFSLVPQLERSQDSSQFQWLSTVLEAVVEAVIQQVLQIRKLTLRGAEQLVVDLEYVQKVTDALGSGSAAGPAAPGDTPSSLSELLDALGFLAAQQRRKQECATSGEQFVEAPREGNPLGRRFERPLRSAFGL